MTKFFDHGTRSGGGVSENSIRFKIRQAIAQTLLNGVHLKNVKFGEHSISMSPGGVDKLQFTNTGAIAADTMGDIYVDSTTGSIHFFDGTAERTVGRDDQIAGQDATAIATLGAGNVGEFLRWDGTSFDSLESSFGSLVVGTDEKYTTIAAAVTAAGTPSVPTPVYIQPGTYAENVSITEDNIVLVGMGGSAVKDMGYTGGASQPVDYGGEDGTGVAVIQSVTFAADVVNSGVVNCVIKRTDAVPVTVTAGSSATTQAFLTGCQVIMDYSETSSDAIDVGTDAELYLQGSKVYTGAIAVTTAAEITTIQTVAQASVTENTYFWLFTGGTSHYFWMDKGTGVDPAPSAPVGAPAGTSGHQVDISSDTTASEVATTTRGVINGLGDFSAPFGFGDSFEVTNVTSEVVRDAEDGASTTGFTISTSQQGASAVTGAYAMDIFGLVRTDNCQFGHQASTATLDPVSNFDIATGQMDGAIRISATGALDLTDSSVYGYVYFPAAGGRLWTSGGQIVSDANTATVYSDVGAGSADSIIVQSAGTQFISRYGLVVESTTVADLIHFSGTATFSPNNFALDALSNVNTDNDMHGYYFGSPTHIMNIPIDTSGFSTNEVLTYDGTVWTGTSGVPTTSSIATAVNNHPTDTTETGTLKGNLNVDLASGHTWAFRDATSADLATITEAGAASIFNIGSQVGTYNNAAADVNFTNGITADNGSNPINVGVTASQIDGATLTVTATTGDLSLTTDANGDIDLIPNGTGIVDVQGTEFQVSATTFDVNATTSDFLNGISVDTGAAISTIDIGVTANAISTASNLFLIAGPAQGNVGQLQFDDSFRPVSFSGRMALSSAVSDWTDFETNFGEVSLLNAINQAYTTGSSMQQAFDQQGATPVNITNNVFWDLEGAGQIFAIRDDLEFGLLTVTEGSAGGTTDISISNQVDTYVNSAADVDFTNGIQVRTGGTSLSIGTTTGNVTSSGALNLSAASNNNATLQAVTGTGDARVLSENDILLQNVGGNGFVFDPALRSITTDGNLGLNAAFAFTLDTLSGGITLTTLGGDISMNPDTGDDALINLDDTSVFAVTSDAGATDILAVTAGAGGDTFGVVASTFTVNAGASEFTNSATFNAGGGNPIYVGDTAGTISSFDSMTYTSAGATTVSSDDNGVLLLEADADGATGEVQFSDSYKSTNYTGNLPLAESAADWTNFVAQFGDGTSLLAALTSSAASAGLDPKESVRLATTTYLDNVGNGTWTESGSGLGKTMTAGAVGTTTIDGEVLSDGDRVLVKDEADAAASTNLSLEDNGIYVASATAGGSATILTRATDQDGTPASEVSGGNFTFVEAGTLAATGWVVVFEGDIVVDTDDIIWTQFNGAGNITAGYGLNKTGNTISVDLTEDFDTTPWSGNHRWLNPVKFDASATFKDTVVGTAGTNSDEIQVASGTDIVAQGDDNWIPTTDNNGYLGTSSGHALGAHRWKEVNAVTITSGDHKFQHPTNGARYTMTEHPTDGLLLRNDNTGDWFRLPMIPCDAPE